MFDLDEFVADCQKANTETEPRGAVRDVLSRALSPRGEVADVMRPEQGSFELVYNSPDLTVLHVVWAPGMTLYPHDHRMWAVIGIYAGQEDNTFFRRSAEDRTTLTESGGKSLATGDLLMLGDDTIHSVTNPLSSLTGALHVYGGDFANEPRSQWGPGPVEERPYDIEEARQQFIEANEAWHREGGP